MKVIDSPASPLTNKFMNHLESRKQSTPKMEQEKTADKKRPQVSFGDQLKRKLSQNFIVFFYSFESKVIVSFMITFHVYSPNYF